MTERFAFGRGERVNSSARRPPGGVEPAAKSWGLVRKRVARKPTVTANVAGIASQRRLRPLVGRWVPRVAPTRLLDKRVL